MQFRIKEFFLEHLGSNSNWNTLFSKENIIKETPKAIFLEHPQTKELKWVPKSVLVNLKSEEDLHSVPDDVSLPNFCSEEKPSEIKEMLKRCEVCGCANDKKCSMYNNMNVEYALLLCMKNDIEEKERENDFLRYQIQQLQETRDK